MGDTHLCSLSVTAVIAEINIMGYTEVEVVLKRGEDVWLWVIERCPFCGEEHVHGGGSLDGNPRRLLGYRVAHCGDDAVIRVDRYRLVESPLSTGEGQFDSMYQENLQNLISSLC